jgi:hypothetical protein
LRICSGLMYDGVPRSMPLRVLLIMPPAASITFAIPKSRTLTTGGPAGSERGRRCRFHVAVNDMPAGVPRRAPSRFRARWESRAVRLVREARLGSNASDAPW